MVKTRQFPLAFPNKTSPLKKQVSNQLDYKPVERFDGFHCLGWMKQKGTASMEPPYGSNVPLANHEQMSFQRCFKWQISCVQDTTAALR